MDRMEIQGEDGQCGVIVARFQTPYLTPGHKRLIESVKSRHPKFMIVLGVAKHIPSKLNPLDFATRQAMIQEQYPGTIVLPIFDVRSDEDWSQNLDTLLRSVMPIGSIVLYGNRDSFIPHYKGRFKTSRLVEEESISGTEARNQAFNEVRASEDFRRGICYAVASQWPKVIPTVDVAITRHRKVLLGRKPGEKQFRFIGGYVEPMQTLAEVACREAFEEALENYPSYDSLTYIGSTPIADWRYNGTKDQILTTFFQIEYREGAVRAGDDIEEVNWFDIESVKYEKDIVREHGVLWLLFVHHMQSIHHNLKVQNV